MSWWDDITSGLGTALNWVTSPGGSNLIGTGANLLASYYGSQEQEDAAQQAIQAIQSASQQSAATQEQMFNKAIALTQPYREMGAALLPAYQKAASGETDIDLQLLAQLGNQGLYDWQKEEVANALNKQLAARGRLDSGAALRAQGDQSRALAAEEANRKWGQLLTLSNQRYGRLLDAANMGANQSAGGAGIVANQATNAGSTIMQGGLATATPLQDAGAARASMYSNAAGAVQNYGSNNTLLNALGIR